MRRLSLSFGLGGTAQRISAISATRSDGLAAIEAGEIEVGATNPVIVDWYRHEHPATTVRIPEGYEPIALRCLSLGYWSQLVDSRKQ